MRSTIALFLLTAPFAWSRLGDSPEECAKQYGKPSTPPIEDSGFTSIGYEHKGVIISVTYKNGIATSVGYNRQGKPYSEKEIEEILRQEAGPGNHWKENLNPAIGQSGIGRIWLGSSGDRMAIVNKTANSISISVKKPAPPQPSAR